MQTNHKPRLIDHDQQVMEASNRSQTRNHPARCGRKQLHMVSSISMEQSLKCRDVGFEMAKYWYRVTEGHKLRRICSQGSYCIGLDTCPADGVSLALMSTLLLIPDSFCAGAKTIPDRASSVHTWEQ